MLEVRDLHVEVEGKKVLQGISLNLGKGEVHAIMGRNGSGKTTLANSLMGHPHYVVTQGDILLNGESIVGLSTYERAQRRLFLAFQYPVAIPGVTVGNFLRASIRAVRTEEVPVKEIRRLILSEAQSVGVPENFLKAKS